MQWRKIDIFIWRMKYDWSNFLNNCSTKISERDLDMGKVQWTISIPKSLNTAYNRKPKIMPVNSWWKNRGELSAHRLPLCLAVVVLGMWMGSFRAPRRWTVRSWITSRMCLIQSCLFSILEAWGRTRQRVRRETFTGSVTTPELPTQNKVLYLSEQIRSYV